MGVSGSLRREPRSTAIPHEAAGRPRRADSYRRHPSHAASTLPFARRSIVIRPAFIRACRSIAPSCYPNRALRSALQHARPHPLMFVLISFADASAIVALGARPKHGLLILALLWWSQRFFPLVKPRPGERLPYFSIDGRLRARRGASK